VVKKMPVLTVVAVGAQLIMFAEKMSLMHNNYVTGVKYRNEQRGSKT
jgi:hypothetical protein